MLQDSSTGFEKTWKFLERRMEEASLVHDFLVKSEDATHHLQNAVGSAFTTVRVSKVNIRIPNGITYHDFCFVSGAKHSRIKL